MHPSIDGVDARAHHARLAGLLLGMPFLFAAATGQLLAPMLSTTGAMATGFAVLAGGWLALVSLASTGRQGIAVAAFGLAAVLLSVLIAAAGGPLSPMILLAAMLVFEPLWVRRDLSVLRPAAAVAVAVLVAQQLLGWSGMVPVTEVSGWHWLLPALYLASVLLRCKLYIDEAAAERAEPVETPVEALFEMAVLKLADNGDVADARGGVENLFGVAPAMLLSTGLFERLHVADRVAYLSAVADMREGATSRRLELRLRAPAVPGHGPAAYRSFTVELAPSGKADAPFAALFRDGSDIGQMRGRLEAARDLADGGTIAKDRFIASVSHELRTPLNAILGFSDMLLADMAGNLGDPRQRDYIGLIRESGSHLLSLVNSILDVSKIESGAYDIRPEPFRLGEAVEAVRSMLSHQAEAKAVTLTAPVAPGTGDVCADSRAVRQMLINLVANAIKFTPQGGAVTVAARRLGSRVLLTVSDTGIGIAAADLGRLGKPFSQVQNDYTREFEGTGLGLAVVKGLVALHKGTLTIESTEGEGTVVTISLPVDGPFGASRRSENMNIVDEATHGTLRKIA
ncbi:MAG: sensor histidine kinase [Rhizobiaceae bacterium]